MVKNDRMFDKSACNKTLSLKLQQCEGHQIDLSFEWGKILIIDKRCKMAF